MNKVIDLNKKGPEISKYIYGHFSEHLGRCIYEGYWVGEDEEEIEHVNGIRQDVVRALREIDIPVLRWPGGCFADEYHWKDGVGPREDRQAIVNTHWGGVTESNHFGTHEFFELVRQLGTEAYINGNVGSGSVSEMQEWVEYMTMDGESPMSNWRRQNGQDEPWKVKFFGVGNESWGCGGNMRPEYYSDLYNRYQTYVRQYSDDKLYKIACGPNIDDYNWMEILMRYSTRFMDGISLHHYALTGPWEDKGPATDFPVEHWDSLITSAYKMDEFITNHSAIMDKYDPDRRVDLIVDEWGSWLAVEPGTNPGFLYQQNTIRDAMVAAITLNIFHKHAGRVHMANIAQTVNVLQAMILTEGKEMIKTPSFYVFYLYKYHQDAVEIETHVDRNDPLTYTLSEKDGVLTLSLCNYSMDEAQDLSLTIEQLGELVSAEYIVGQHNDDHNTFEQPDNIQLLDFDQYDLSNDNLKVTAPPMSVISIRAKIK
ncbi:alpha-N-arabinofuranosidase [Fundicoccus sp. Sow4_H7]|uniref:alpha-N-arabinofuranosidase n=1 Tax=Fundicoccus sp. Sow4_H7 TaxID=3438784 RepID=UPI003F93377E